MHAGAALAGAGLGLGHAMAQALGGRYGIAHGAANAVCLPAALRFNEPVAAAEIGAFREAVGGGTRPLAWRSWPPWAASERLRDLGVPRGRARRGGGSHGGAPGREGESAPGQPGARSQSSFGRSGEFLEWLLAWNWQTFASGSTTCPAGSATRKARPSTRWRRSAPAAASSSRSARGGASRRPASASARRPGRGSRSIRSTATRTGRFRTSRRTFEKAGIAELVTPIRSRSQDAWQEFDEPIELLFIDGAHQYDLVKDDFDHWVPKVVDGGVVAMHDTTWFEGPRRVADEMVFKSRQFKNARFVFSSTSLGTKVPENTAVDRARNRYSLTVKKGVELSRKILDKDRLPAPLQAGRPQGSAEAAVSDDWRLTVELAERGERARARERPPGARARGRPPRSGRRSGRRQPGRGQRLPLRGHGGAGAPGERSRPGAAGGARLRARTVALTRWHPVEQRWEDASVPLPDRRRSGRQSTSGSRPTRPPSRLRPGMPLGRCGPCFRPMKTP